jgi:hypothetical protein
MGRTFGFGGLFVRFWMADQEMVCGSSFKFINIVGKHFNGN